MQNKIIRSVISLSLIGSMVLSLCSCASAPHSENSGETNSASVSEDIKLSPLMTAYGKAQDCSESIKEAVKNKDSASLFSEADIMLQNLKDIRTQTENEFVSARKTAASLGNDIFIERQRDYEAKVISKLNEAENAAKALKSTDESIRSKSAELISSMFAKDEEDDVLVLGDNYRNVKEKLKTTSSSASNGLQLPTDDDLIIDKEVTINDEIKAVCDNLNGVREIYEFVKNGVAYRPYYNSRKGAVAVFEQMSGNDADQAALLIGMLRYKGIPAKYARGNVFITKEQAVAITGADTPENAGAILAAQYKPVILNTVNGEISGFTMEQIWVKAYVPYTDYRGIGNKSGESVWVNLDPSFKELTVEPMSLDVNTADEHVTERTQAMKKIIPDYVPDEKITVNSRYIKRTVDKYLPVSLPYQLDTEIESFSFMPDSRRDSISVSVGWSNLFSLPISELYGKAVTVSFEPETDSDKSLIESSGGIDKVPAYLVSVVPTVTIGEKQYRGKYPVTLGTQQSMNITLKNASGNVGMTDTLYAGNVYSIVIDMQSICQQDLKRSEDRVRAVPDNLTDANVYSSATLGPILDYAGKWYFAGCDSFADTTCVSMDICRTRLLGIAVTGYSMTRESLFGYISHLDYGNFMIDVDYNSNSAISFSGNKDDEIAYMLLVGSRESDFEGALWEEILGDDSTIGISTAALFAIASSAGVSPVILTNDNIDEELAECSVSDTTKNSVRNLVNQGRVVLLIPKEITVNDWKGSAYIATDMEDGSSAYMITGGLAGGSTDKKTNLKGIIDLKNHQQRDMTVNVCTTICLIISKINEVLGWCSLASDMVELEGTATSPAGLKAGISIIGDTKDLCKAELLYFGTLDKFLKYYVSHDEAEKDKVTKKLLKSAIDSVVDFFYNCLTKVANTDDLKTTFKVDGVEFEHSFFDDTFNAFNWSDVIAEMKDDDSDDKLLIDPTKVKMIFSVVGLYGFIGDTYVDYIKDLIDKCLVGDED